MPKRRELQPGERRVILKKGQTIRTHPMGRDEENGVVRVELQFTLEEWDEMESRALKRNMFASEWIKWLVRRKLGPPFSSE